MATNTWIKSVLTGLGLALSVTHPAAIAQDAQSNVKQDANDLAFLKWRWSNLRDPDSALLRKTKEPYRTEITLKRGILGKKQWFGDVACYVLNAKNAYGAYTGYTPFAVIVTVDGQDMVFEGMPPSEQGEAFRSYGQQIIDNYC
jgi:hypothetical protein